MDVASLVEPLDMRHRVDAESRVAPEHLDQPDRRTRPDRSVGQALRVTGMDVVARMPEAVAVVATPGEDDVPFEIAKPPVEHARRDATHDVVPDPVFRPTARQLLDAAVGRTDRLQRKGQVERDGESGMVRRIGHRVVLDFHDKRHGTILQREGMESMCNVVAIRIALYAWYRIM